jgi:hypothetical protein
MGFIADRGIDVATVHFTGKGEDNVVLTQFADPDLRSAFTEYHDERARFEVISERANHQRRRKSGS